MDVRKLLNDYMKQNNKTLSDVAKATGLSKSTICRISTGAVIPSANASYKIIDLLRDYIPKPKKLFISVPMRLRTEENIKKSMEGMHKIAEFMFGEELEVIDVFITELEVSPSCKDERVLYLGESIKKLSEADYYIGVHTWVYNFSGCEVENATANLYFDRTNIRFINIEEYPSLFGDISKKLVGETCDAAPSMR